MSVLLHLAEAGIRFMYTPGMNAYVRIFKAFHTANVEYIVVGGVAMNLLGYPRFTGDIDVLLALDPMNLQRMAKLMKKLGYEQRLPVSVEELGDEKKTLRLIREKNLIAYNFHHSRMPQYGIDVIVGESLKFNKYKKHAHCLEADGVPIPLVSIDDLISMKRKTKRPKDWEDVQALLELKGL